MSHCINLCLLQTEASLTEVESNINWIDHRCLCELSTMSSPIVPSEKVLGGLTPYAVLI